MGSNSARVISEECFIIQFTSLPLVHFHKLGNTDLALVANE